MRSSVSDSEICSCLDEVSDLVLADRLFEGVVWIIIGGCVRLRIRDVC